MSGLSGCFVPVSQIQWHSTALPKLVLLLALLPRNFKPPASGLLARGVRNGSVLTGGLSGSIGRADSLRFGKIQSTKTANSREGWDLGSN
mgnify:CR=1 FL=1